MSALTTTRSAASSRSHAAARFCAALIAAAAVVAGLPALLLVAADARFGHLSPLHGMNAPWRWTAADARSWGRRLTRGLDTSAALVDLFLRIALVIGWICVAILIYSVVDEVVFQVRHGMPSGHRRRLVGLGPLGRRLASALVAVLPLIASTTPTLAGRPVTPVAALVLPGGGRLAQADLPSAPSVAPTIVTDAGGWSMVEVRRGDSVWAIAERIADGRDVAALARQIVVANLGTVMNDGHRFSTPALIEPGWMLNVPATVTAAAPPSVSRSLADPSGLAAPADTYVVVRGDSYWKIAEEHLEPSAGPGDVAAYTEQLIDLNAPHLAYVDQRMIHPGDVVQLRADTPADAAAVSTPSLLPPPTAAAVTETPRSTGVALPPPTTLPAPTQPTAPPQPPSPLVPAAQPVSAEQLLSGEGVPVRRGLGAALLLAGGAIGVLEARRRRQLRSAPVGARLPLPVASAVATEMQLRSLSDAERLARLDLALRSAAPGLIRQQARVLAVEIGDDGELRVFTDRPTHAADGRWQLDSDGESWRLPAHVSLVELADDARGINQPCPAIVHVGRSAGGQLFVDLEAVGVLSIEAPPELAASIVRCAAATLAVSPFLESSRVFTVGLGPEAGLGSPIVESHGSIGVAIDAVRSTVGSIATATSGTATTFALRTHSSGGEAWEPSLLLAVGSATGEGLGDLVSLAGGGGRGVGAMVDRPLAGSGAVLRAADGDFVLEPLGRRVTPVGLTIDEVCAVDELLASAELVVPVDADRRVELPSPAALVEFMSPRHELVVHLLGQVEVSSAGGATVAFERSKALELVVWLSQHRHRPTRAAARTALWEVAVRDATFSNVVSEARRALARSIAPPVGQEWIGRTMNEDLPLHELVVSDAELLGRRAAAARGLGDCAAIDVLRPGVELITGMPFEGTSYLWPDAEGITSSLVLLATSAAAELAGRYLAIGDVDGVFWATGQGLKVLAGHETLIALRMRAHADRGDLAGVRSEWASYERAVQADSWAAAEPSPKLVELRHQLLSPRLAS